MTSNGGRGLSGKLSKWPEEKPNVQAKAKANHKVFFFSSWLKSFNVMVLSCSIEMMGRKLLNGF